MNKILILMILFTLSACVSTQKFLTKSGRPEVVVWNVPKKIVVDELSNRMVSKGFNIKEANDYSITYSKVNDSISASLLFGSQYDSFPEAQIKNDIINVQTGEQSGVRIVASVYAVINPGSAFERKTDLSQSWDAQKYFDFLNNIKLELEEKFTVHENQN